MILTVFSSATSDRGWYSGTDSEPWVYKSRSSFLIKMGLTQISISYQSITSRETYTTVNNVHIFPRVVLFSPITSCHFVRVLKLCLKVEALMFAFHRICRQVIWTWIMQLKYILFNLTILTIIVSWWSRFNFNYQILWMISPQATTFLTEDEERLKDFKLRLQVLERIFNFPLGEEQFFVFWFLFGEWEWLRIVSVSCARSHWIYWEVKGIP